MHRFSVSYINRLFPLILTIWIGLQLKGYYWILAVFLFLSIYRNRASLPLFFSFTRNVLLSALLLIFSLALLAAAAFDSGLQGLVTEVPVSLPILPIFILSCILSLLEKQSIAARSKYCLYALGVGVLALASSFWQWLHLSDSPASSLRPIEILASSGGFLLIAIINCCLFTFSSGDRKRLYQISLYILSLALSLISFSCFRGVTSASVFVLNVVSTFLLFVLPVIRRFGLLIVGLFIAFSSLALTLVVDFRFLLLKFLVVPLASSDIANGRAALLNSWIANYGQERPLLLGAQPFVPADFFAHNIIFDSLIKDGSFAASSLLLFGVSIFFFLLRHLSKGYEARSFLNFLQFCLMAIPALLQPVQFSHSFAFLLSISTLGILVSWPNGQLPDLPSPSLGG